MVPKAAVIRLERKTRSELEGWLRASTTEQRMVRRARIVLLAADGWASRAIARKVGVMTGVVSVWRTRFAALGIDGLEDNVKDRAPYHRPEDLAKDVDGLRRAGIAD
jgi:Helix-turn-helix domain